MSKLESAAVAATTPPKLADWSFCKAEDDCRVSVTTAPSLSV